MLVLTRKIGESIYIGSDIKVTVKRISGTQRCQLLISAPKELDISRKDNTNEPNDPSGD